MKTSLFILFCLYISVFSSCKTELDMKNPDVDQFVKMIKKGNYFKQTGHYGHPDFSVEDIGTLLHYAKDTMEINEFPTNPVSSKYTTPKRLSEGILWTIEGIRLGNKYPSLEPCLVDTSLYSLQTAYPRVSGKQLLQVADIYLNWHKEYVQHPSEELKTKNLLKGTTFVWN